MQQTLLIASIVWLVVLSPGADFAMVSRNACLYGRRSGIEVSVGIALACWFHVAYAIFGIALLQQIFPRALDIIKLLGAAYLIYIGLTTAWRGVVVLGAAKDLPDRSSSRSVAIGVLTNGLNPKTAIFVVSLFSQFIGRDTPLIQELAWGVFISLSHLAWFVIVALFLSRPDVRRLVLRRQKAFNLAIGFVLTSLGVLLLVVEKLHGATA